jgi:hypothetical protein
MPIFKIAQAGMLTDWVFALSALGRQPPLTCSIKRHARTLDVLGFN